MTQHCDLQKECGRRPFKNVAKLRYEQVTPNCSSIGVSQNQVLGFHTQEFILVSWQYLEKYKDKKNKYFKSRSINIYTNKIYQNILYIITIYTTCLCMSPICHCGILHLCFSLCVYATYSMSSSSSSFFLIQLLSFRRVVLLAASTKPGKLEHLQFIQSMQLHIFKAL